jgi:hypothetical protein
MRAQQANRSYEHAWPWARGAVGLDVHDGVAHGGLERPPCISWRVQCSRHLAHAQRHMALCRIRLLHQYTQVVHLQTRWPQPRQRWPPTGPLADATQAVSARCNAQRARRGRRPRRSLCALTSDAGRGTVAAARGGCPGRGSGAIKASAASIQNAQEAQTTGRVTRTCIPTRAPLVWASATTRATTTMETPHAAGREGLARYQSPRAPHPPPPTHPHNPPIYLTQPTPHRTHTHLTATSTYRTSSNWSAWTTTCVCTASLERHTAVAWARPTTSSATGPTRGSELGQGQRRGRPST